jgi:hypothetical protein
MTSVSETRSRRQQTVEQDEPCSELLSHCSGVLHEKHTIISQSSELLYLVLTSKQLRCNPHPRLVPKQTRQRHRRIPPLAVATRHEIKTPTSAHPLTDQVRTNAYIYAHLPSFLTSIFSTSLSLPQWSNLQQLLPRTAPLSGDNHLPLSSWEQPMVMENLQFESSVKPMAMTDLG